MAGAAEIISEISTRIKQCEKCALHKTRTNAVTYRGTPKKGVIVFVGEAPGHMEDIEGRPFVGVSGKLLDKWIEYLELDDYYITNVVKCRPPRNRAPILGEINRCGKYLKQEIETIQPMLVVVLGRTAERAMNLLGIDAPTKFVYHPSYFLRIGGREEHWMPFIGLLKEHIDRLKEADND